MEKYGCTIRKIRLSKGFSQKEIYTGILSKSYAIDFEKGNYDIKFSVMLQILQRLMVSVDELMMIHHDYGDTKSDGLLYNIDAQKFKANQTYADDMVRTLYASWKAKNTLLSKIEYAQASALNMLYFSPCCETSKEYQWAKQVIQRYLFDIETWTFKEFRLFSNMSFLFGDTEVRTDLFLRAWKSLEKYKHHSDFSVYLAHLLANNLFHLIYTAQFDYARKALDRLYALTKEEEMLTWRVLLLFLEGFYLYAIGKTKQGLEEIEKAKQVYRLTKHNQMIEQIDQGLLLLKKK
ncbi:Rgg/GadR/MutR family transcriptional regulator [Beduini massiliensis]|uniref:Rgg/GadR/MutR family transcriptional regulator n=1 Tax=Beduini massiliensis TaxID=1585974 RepID=UPI00059A9C3F|nr:Rgg/GadR/MutR family transcriptional regulator [Beduini massiliensis]